jgi:hypothetical protein
VLEPFQRLGIPTAFYSINELLEPNDLPSLQEGEAMLYTNYFGLKDQYCDFLAANHPNVILDCTQALFYVPCAAVDAFYSYRKFVGVADGAFAHLADNARLPDRLPSSTSAELCSHLLMRRDAGAEAGYPAFQQNDRALSNRTLSAMSTLTRQHLQSLDLGAVAVVRTKNYETLHGLLGAQNRAAFVPGSSSGPLCYPFYATDPELRNYLLSQSIFVARYWPNVLQWTDESQTEHRLTRHLIHLPVDQRYSAADMAYIAQHVKYFE